MPLTIRHGDYPKVPLVVDPAVEAAGLGALDPADSPPFAPDWDRPKGTAFDSMPQARHPARSAIGTMTWPAWGMARFAVGHFLCHAEHATRIRELVELAGIEPEVVESSGDASWPSPFTLELSAPSSSGDTLRNHDVVELPVYPLPARPLVALEPDASGSSRGIYLLTVVDIRYFLRGWSVRQDIELDLAALDDPPGRAWSDLMRALAEDMGITLDLEPEDIPGEYLVPHPSLATLAGQDAPAALDAVAASVGRRVVARLDGTFSAQSAVEALRLRAEADADRGPGRARRSGGGDLFARTL